MNPPVYFAIPLDSPVVQWNGKPALFGNEILQMSGVLMSAVTQVTESDKEDSPDVRRHKMQLAAKISQASHIELDLHDVIFLAPLVIRAFVHPLVYMSFVQICAQSAVQPQAAVIPAPPVAPPPPAVEP
jgi:hypothetical protein